MLELINEFSKLAGYKINIEKSVAFLYTNNETSEKEMKKTLPFTSIKNNNIPMNKLNQGSENYVQKKPHPSLFLFFLF